MSTGHTESYRKEQYILFNEGLLGNKMSYCDTRESVAMWLMVVEEMGVLCCSSALS